MLLFLDADTLGSSGLRYEFEVTRSGFIGGRCRHHRPSNPWIVVILQDSADPGRLMGMGARSAQFCRPRLPFSPSGGTTNTIYHGEDVDFYLAQGSNRAFTADITSTSQTCR